MGHKKILIVDDHPILRKGLAMVIDQEPDLVVAGEAEDVPGGLDMIEAVKPDVVIVDISLPGVDGIELIKTMKLKYRDLPALVVSMHDETLYAERALRAGARGYIMKQEAVDKVLVAIRKVLKGEIFVSDRITTKMVETLISGDAKGASTPLDLLSNRELTVFRLIGQGFKTSQIADKLHLSVKTIESYRSHIKEKLRLSTGNDLMKYAIQWAQNGN
ncbi:MAG TPA: response regulator transcription factor [Deltaproteobacteria bacterium]|jgi:DNA-binding NarL/FixJ family response regulator|nr:response regulator transcription factor [Deltaproteobacteria bacterium]OQC21113.1 MAG: Oxygen regulatory protein NreC [Deltaproteobacteria bacterium ADurb.Bin072]HRW79314.1 response regulator transcription factor [Desulfomonilia bacterium]HNQ84816.1 response regulator transcription factor [Deltaproteobacteria bacterium]HNS89621.1 response regulator transcription factor [Deltaproteobacteria bacterium]